MALNLKIYKFCSTDENNKVGSIYFEGGRIRLVHDYGPAVEQYNNEPVRYKIPRNNLNKLNIISEAYNKTIYRENFSKVEYFITKDCSGEKLSEYPKDIDIAKNFCLVEIFKLTNDIIWIHISRGMAISIDISDITPTFGKLYSIANQVGESGVEAKKSLTVEDIYYIHRANVTIFNLLKDKLDIQSPGKYYKFTKDKRNLVARGPEYILPPEMLIETKSGKIIGIDNIPYDITPDTIESV